MILERPALERRIAASLEAGRIPVVLGGCGSGRTSLLLRLAGLLGAERTQYLDLAAVATTPERCLAAIVDATPFRASVGPLHSGRADRAIDSPRAAFEALLSLFDESTTADGRHVTFLLDEILDVRTFESFPGLRHVQRETVARLADSPNQFVLTSRFTARAHRLLRDAPARFEVIHAPALEASEVQATAGFFSGGQPEWPGQIAPAVLALSAGRPAYVALLVDTLASGSVSGGAATDPVAALAALMAPDGRLTARCRESYEFRLHRARGYGALKAILGILAAQEPINLTEIAQHLRRTPGSTKDYLSWLEDVDLVTMQRKRYTIEDPLLRLYIRLYAKPVPPTDADLVREVRAYAQTRLARSVAETPEPIREPAMAAAVDRTVEVTRSGIIEID
jgi:hypothetical protein